MASFAPEVIFQIGRFPVTNTILDTILVDGVLMVLVLAIRKKLSTVPGKFQTMVEYVIGGLYNFTKSIAEEKTDKFFPWFMTFFLVILLANWSALIPGLSTVGLPHHTKEGLEIIPYLRPASSDLNFTLALSIVSLAATHALSIRELGFSEYLSRYFAFIPFILGLFKKKSKAKREIKHPMEAIIGFITFFVMIFVGFLELILEVVKGISLSFRLFGNIFAGETVLATVSHIFAFIFPLPFFALEIIVGLVQALVFAMLTLAFMIILTTPHHEDSKEVSH